MAKEQRKEKVKQKAASGGSLKQILDVSQLLGEIRKNLGLKPTVQMVEKDGKKTKEKVWVETDHALLNQEGIENTIAFVRSHVGKNLNLSEFGDKAIMRRMRIIHETYARLIAENWENWSVERRAKAHSIVSIVTDSIEAAYRRAFEGKERDMIKGITEEKSTQRVVSKDKDEGSFFGVTSGGK